MVLVLKLYSLVKLINGDREMKYPAILKPNYDSSIRVLVFNEENAIHLEGIHKGIRTHYHIDEDVENITHEYLSNTWGVVESKEHAEFIVEIAKLYGIRTIKWGEKVTHFNFRITHGVFSLNLLGFNFSKENLKQITIPLPPKSPSSKVLERLPQPPKHIDCICNKCGGKCCIGNCDEWLKVGGRVLFTPNPSINYNIECTVTFIGSKYIILIDGKGKEYSRRKAKAIIEKLKASEEELRDEWPKTGDKVEYNGSKCKVLLTADKSYHIVVVGDSGNYMNPHLKDIKKLKTPEEEIEYDLADLIMRARDAESTDIIIAKSIMSKYKLTKE